jgi:hypothetical protein
MKIDGDLQIKNIKPGTPVGNIGYDINGNLVSSNAIKDLKLLTIHTGTTHNLIGIDNSGYVVIGKPALPEKSVIYLSGGTVATTQTQTFNGTYSPILLFNAVQVGNRGITNVMTSTLNYLQVSKNGWYEIKYGGNFVFAHAHNCFITPIKNNIPLVQDVQFFSSVTSTHMDRVTWSDSVYLTAGDIISLGIKTSGGSLTIGIKNVFLEIKEDI